MTISQVYKLKVFCIDGIYLVNPFRFPYRVQTFQLMLLVLMKVCILIIEHLIIADRISYASTYKPTSSSSWNLTSVSTNAFPLRINPSDVAGVRYAYVTIGSVTLISFVLFAISHLLNRFNSGGSFSPTSLSSHSSKHSTSSRSKESNVDGQASKDLPGCPENPPSDIPIDGDYVRLDR